MRNLSIILNKCLHILWEITIIKLFTMQVINVMRKYMLSNAPFNIIVKLLTCTYTVLTIHLALICYQLFTAHTIIIIHWMETTHT